MGKVKQQGLSQGLLFLGVLLVAANLRAPFTGLPPLLDTIRSELGLSTAAAGALTTLPLLAFALVSPLGPWLARRYGLERALFAALVVIVLGTVLRSLGASGLLYGGTCLIGAGIAVGNVLLPGVIKHDFSQRVGTVTGAYVLSMGIAAALGSAAVIPVADLVGWRWALMGFLLLSLPALAVWAVTLRTSPSLVTARTSAPADGLLRSPLAWQITLFLGLNSTIYYVAVSWLPEILVDAGFSASEAGFQHGLMQLATALPGLVIGPILQRLPDQRIPAVGVALCSAVALVGFWLAPALAVLWSILFGIGTGAGIILGLALVALRASSVQQAARLSGMSQSIGYLLAATGPIAVGALHEWQNSWALSLVLCSLLALLAALMGLLAGRNRRLGQP